MQAFHLMSENVQPALPARPHPADGAAVQTWLDAVIVRYYRELYRYAMSLSRHESDAADLTQQTAVKFAQNWASIRDDGGIKSWLYTTLYREFLLLRRRTKDTIEFDESHAAEEHSPQADAGVVLDARTALEVLGRMDEPHRSVLSLFYVEDLSYREIADILGVPPGTVMSRLSRAKELLRELLSPSQ